MMGIDSSSVGIAWAIREGDSLITGKINTQKIKELPDKIAHGCKELSALIEEHKPDFIWVEKSIYVKNPATVRTLSYIVGGIMATAGLHNTAVGDVDPATWKAFFGYRNLKREYVASVKKILGNTDGKKFCEELRKSQTRSVLINHFPDWDIPLDDHDISDAVGIVVWGWNQLVEEEEIEKSDHVRYDLVHLANLGIDTP